MRQLLNQLIQLKTQLREEQAKFGTLKTKTAKEKRREKIIQLRREFNKLAYDQLYPHLNSFNLFKLNLMAPGGGPWANFEFKTAIHEHDQNRYITLVCWDGTKYVGEFSLLDDKCGIDNLAKLSDQVTA